MEETVGSVPGYFRNMARNLNFLRNNEDFTDLTFLCLDGPVHCHKAMLLTHSPLLKYLFSVSASKQASDTTVISLPDIEKGIMAELLQYVYKGQTSKISILSEGRLYELSEMLDFDMSFAKKGSEVDGPAATSKTKKKKDTNKKKQTAEKEPAKEAPQNEALSAAQEIPEDLASAFLKKFQGHAQSQGEAAPVAPIIPVQEVSPIIVSGKRKRVSQAVEDTKGKKYQYFTSNKVSRYQDESDDEGAITGQKEKSFEIVSDEEDLAVNAELIVEECTKQRAALDKMKIGLKNCGCEENVKQKVMEILDGKENDQSRDMEEHDSQADASITEEVTNDPNVSLSENCNVSVVEDTEDSVLNKNAKKNSERKSRRSKKLEQLKENVEQVEERQLKERENREIDTSVEREKTTGICDPIPESNLNLKENNCPETSDLGEAGTSKELDIDTSTENWDAMEIDARNDANDDADLNQEDLIQEETSKQKASLDNMKVKLINCAKEDHIKEKVEALVNDKETDDSKEQDSEIEDLSSPTKSDAADPDILVIEEIVTPNKKRGRPKKSTSISQNLEGDERNERVVNDSSRNEEVNLVQSDDEVEDPHEKEWMEKAMRDKMKIKMHKLDKDPNVSKVYPKSEIEKLLHQVLNPSDDEEVATKKKNRWNPPLDSSEDSDGEGGDNIKYQKKALPVKSSPVKISSDIQLASRTQICGFCRRIFLSVEAFEAHVKEEHDQGEEDADDENDDTALEEGESPAKKTKKKIGSKSSKSGSIKKSKVRSGETSEESDDSEEDQVKKQGMKRIGTKAKTSDDSSENEDNQFKKKKFKRKKSSSGEEKSKAAKSSATNGNGIDTAILCYKCGIECRNKQELKNHILTHFYPDLFAFLPASKPFTCPTCSALNRDKITLVRHYAFAHKEIYKYCTEEQLNGGTVKGKRKLVNCESSTSKLDAATVEGAQSNGFDGSPSMESRGVPAANSAFFTDSDDDDDLFAARKEATYAVKSFDDLFNEYEAANNLKSVSNEGIEGSSEPSDNTAEKFLGMDDNDPADVDDLLMESE